MNFKFNIVINVVNGLDLFFGKMVVILIVVSCFNDVKNYIFEFILEKFCVFRFYIFIYCICMLYIVFCNVLYCYVYFICNIFIFII